MTVSSQGLRGVERALRAPRDDMVDDHLYGVADHLSSVAVPLAPPLPSLRGCSLILQWPSQLRAFGEHEWWPRWSRQHRLRSSALL